MIGDWDAEPSTVQLGSYLIHPFEVVRRLAKKAFAMLANVDARSFVMSRNNKRLPLSLEIVNSPPMYLRVWLGDLFLHHHAQTPAVG